MAGAMVVTVAMEDTVLDLGMVIAEAEADTAVMAMVMNECNSFNEIASSLLFDY